jgi:hypothetical protein
MVIAPTRSGNIASMEYPTMIVINHDRISSLFSYLPEELVIHEFIHQYFYGIIANNESYEGWLDEGLTSYLTTGVLEKSHSADVSRFHLFGGLNVRGMKLLSMDEVPLIYSLANIKIPFSVNAPMSYYQSLTAANLRDSSYLLPPPIYQNITYGKGELFFKGLEGALGQEKLFSILKSFFNDNKYKHVNATQLFAMIRKTTGASLDWYFSDYYHNAPVCDYRIAGIEHTLGSDRYDVIVRRERTAYWPSDIALYTDRDTLYARCLDSLRTIKITFYTNAEVFGAEIDPYRKNCYDIDIANNSYMIEKQYSAITYFSIRWFYWIQNFLMVFGTLG